MSTSNPTPQEVLLAYFHDHSANIEYTKNRSFFLLAGYSAICAFLISEKENLDNSLSLFVCITLLIGAHLFGSAIKDNYKKIIQRRDILDQVHSELPLSVLLREKIERKLRDKGPVDGRIPYAQITYLYVIFLFTSYLILSSHFTVVFN